MAPGIGSNGKGPTPSASDGGVSPAAPEPGGDVTSPAAQRAAIVSEARTRGRDGSVNSRGNEASNKEFRVREAEEDRALIEQAQNGDSVARRLAFRKLVDRHQRRAFAIAVGLVRDENDAREIVQEAFLRVYKGINTFEGGSSFFTWLYRIVTNLAIDLMRKPGRKGAELDESRDVSEEAEGDFALVSRIDGADPIDVVRRKEMSARIEAALAALPPYHRAVIIMREVEGLSYEEMAEAMSVSKGTIMSRLFHARQKMQKALADVYAELDVTAPRGDGRSKQAEVPLKEIDTDHDESQAEEEV